MRILHFIWSFNTGGAETLLVDLLREQNKHDDITLMIGNAVTAESLLAAIPTGVRIIALKRPEGSKNPFYLIKLLRELSGCRPDIIHAHHESLIRLIRFMDTPRVVTLHTIGISLSARLASYDQVFCISEAVRKDVESRSPFSCRPQVIHNGIPFFHFSQRGDRRPADLRIVQVGRLDHSVKGQDVLIRALQIVRDQFGITNVTVDFIGEGRMKEYLEKLAQECGVSKDCRFLGLKSREFLYDNLQNYDLLVQPSRIEGFGLTVVEGMAARLPVMVSGIDGPLEIVAEGKFGYLFEEGNPVDCARQIVRIIDDYEEGKIADRVEKAYRHALTHYDVERTAAVYREEYLKLVRRKSEAWQG